jgi:hypothetical protein
VPVLADDDVVVYGNPERARHRDDGWVISMSARQGVGSPDSALRH